MATLLNYFDNLESGICVRINRLSRAAGTRWIFATASKLGDGWYWYILGVATLGSGIAGAPQFVLRAALTAAAGIVVYRFLKTRFVRERPCVTQAGVECAAAPLDRYSFPSGHTMHAVSFTILFTAFDPVFLLLTAPFAVLVAASRVILGLHYPSDVLAGAVLGAALAMLGNVLA